MPLVCVCTWSSGWGQFQGLRREVASEERGHLITVTVGVHRQPPPTVGLDKTDTNKHIQTKKRQ